MCIPIKSVKLSREVLPTMGAVTPVINDLICGNGRRDLILPSFAMHHAKAICAMVTPFFFESSSTLRKTILVGKYYFSSQN
jgi:hypothetical protein